MPRHDLLNCLPNNGNTRTPDLLGGSCRSISVDGCYIRSSDSVIRPLQAGPKVVSVTAPTGIPMTYRKLRIAWTVFWGVAAVLLIVLWVRSYWRVQHVVWNSETKAFDISFDRGQLGIGAVNDRIMLPLGWSHRTFPIWSADSDSDTDDTPKTILGFGLETDDISIDAYIPFWFPVLTCAAIAIIPSPLFKRFSLRTLLIATTLVAVVLGLIA